MYADNKLLRSCVGVHTNGFSKLALRWLSSSGAIPPEPFSESVPSDQPHPASQSSSTTTSQRQPRPSKPYTRREPPLSPLLDPAWKAARQKHISPKPRPTVHILADRAGKLETNPYALALISPVRQCIISKTFLPSFFLQDFELIAHPETGQPWYLPRSLTSPYSRHTSSHDASTTEGSAVNEIELTMSDKADPGGPTPPHESRTQSPETTGSMESAKRVPRDPTIGPKTYILCRNGLLASLNAKGAHKDHYKRWLGTRHMGQKYIRVNHIQFRDKIDEFILHLMRKRIVEGLLYLASNKAGYITPCRNEEATSSHRSGKQKVLDEWTHIRQTPSGVVLWLGETATKPGADRSGVWIDDTIPQEFAMIESGARSAHKPVHNLAYLLGESNVQILRDSAPKVFGAANILKLAKKNSTMNVVLRLWKLQGLLARY